MAKQIAGDEDRNVCGVSRGMAGIELNDDDDDDDDNTDDIDDGHDRSFSSNMLFGNLDEKVKNGFSNQIKNYYLIL